MTYGIAKKKKKKKATAHSGLKYSTSSRKGRNNQGVVW